MSRRILRPHSKHEHGFTLSEVLIAIVVLSVGLLGLSAMMIVATNSLAFSKKLTTATTLAQDKLEEIKYATYASVVPANHPVEDYKTIPGFAQFKREVTISAGPVPDTKTVIVTTSWQRHTHTSPYAVTLRTIINKQ
jgi:prepilin-type N-terminal cleavage/methylation domain-containing protein